MHCLSHADCTSASEQHVKIVCSLISCDYAFGAVGKSVGNLSCSSAEEIENVFRLSLSVPVSTQHHCSIEGHLLRDPFLWLLFLRDIFTKTHQTWKNCVFWRLFTNAVFPLSVLQSWRKRYFVLSRNDPVSMIHTHTHTPSLTVYTYLHNKVWHISVSEVVMGTNALTLSVKHQQMLLCLPNPHPSHTNPSIPIPSFEHISHTQAFTTIEVSVCRKELWSLPKPATVHTW